MVLLWSLSVPLFLFAASSSTNNTTTPSIGGLIAWWVCNARKRKPIGGWLMFFYWQLYGGLLVTVIFFLIGIEAYVPENAADGKTFVLLMVSMLLPVVLYVVKTLIATLCLCARTWDMLQLLRWVIIGELVLGVIGLGVDTGFFPDRVSAGLTLFGLVQDVCWLVYLFKADRVRHVFRSHDWDIAVNVIHPPKLKPLTS
jgi:hypothetical protein